MFEVALEEFYSPDAHIFYADHLHISISDLLFKYGNNPLKKAWSLQLESRRRAAQKLPTWAATQRVIFPPKLNVEQASSEFTAKYKAQIVAFNSSLDLTGGTGIDSWQFALKSKKHVFVEPVADLVALATHNLKTLFVDADFFCGTAEAFLAQNTEAFDLVFIDPSRRTESGSKVVLLQDYSPNVVALQNELLKIGKHVLIKVSPFADISYLVTLFDARLNEVHIVAVNNECKEILLLLSSEKSDAPLVKTVNFANGGLEQFNYRFIDEAAKAPIAKRVNQYLFEPNAAILKSGAFNTIATKFGLEKLSTNSHLYTSSVMHAGFPGKIYTVVEVAAPYKLSVKYEKASIATRNFPDKPEQIRKRLKLSDGNDFKIFATTLGSKKIFIVARFLPTHSH